MCGLLGAVAAPAGYVEARLDCLAHRGPDDRGVWRSSDGRVVLGHRRLSVIDVSSAGHQPMTSDDESVVLAFNGEIYNYREVRDDLRALGHRFRSDSDTEVLLAAYREWGRSCVDRFVGMWAFALHDTRSRELWLCRDPFGIKPLFVVQRPDVVAYASELEPLLDLVDRRMDLQTAYDYLRWGHVDRGSHTFIDGVQRLSGGESLIVPVDDLAKARRERYFQLPSRLEESDLSFVEAADHLRGLLTRSVELHMRSDVAIGSALSGGVDSSGVVMLMRHVGGEGLDLHTFSYLAVGDPSDETKWVEMVAASSGARRHDVLIAPADLPELIDVTMRHQFEPFGSLSIVAQLAVFRAARAAGVTVMLDGQGADELFAGYPSFRTDLLAELVRRGHWVAAARLAERVREHDGSGAVARALARAVPRPVAVALWSRWMSRREPAWLDTDWFASGGVRVQPDARDLPRSFDAAVEASQSSLSLNGLLRYEDRNSMAWSVESRVPYLTADLARFAASLPAEYLIDREGRNKAVLVAALRGLVPDAVLDRRDKVAFAVPQQRWLQLLPPAAPPAPGIGLRAGAEHDLRARLFDRFVAVAGLRA